MTDSGQHGLDSDTVDRLYTTYCPSLRPFLIGLLRNNTLAEEALQNTFHKVLTGGGEVDPQRWKPWLFQVAYNEAMQLRRRERIDVRALQRIARTTPNHGLHADEGLIQAEQLARLRAAIRQLSPDQQEVVQRRVYHEQAFQKIADELQIPLGTVLTRMRLATAKLRKAMQDAGDNHQHGP